MKQILKSVSLIIIIALSFNSAAQETIEFSRAYGSDPWLFNGQLYRYHPNIPVKGSPLLYDTFSKGTLRISETVYNGRILNLDIYNNQLIMQYTAEDGGINRIVISDAWLEGFEINGSLFEPVRVGDSAAVYCKVLKSANLKVVYYLRKEIVMGNQIGSKFMQFSKPLKNSFLSFNDELHKYNNNRSFMAFFTEPIRQDIKKYLRQNRIRVNKADDLQITELLKFCEELL